MLRTTALAIFCSLLLAAVACHSGQASGGEAMKLEISSNSFPEQGNIPKQFTCDAEDRSPELHWSKPPAGTKSLALIADDPDAPAGTWVHWVLFNLPADTQDLPEGVPKQDALDNGAVQGTNDFGKVGYGGPCPPPGKPHRYFFKVYALDTNLSLKTGAKKADVEGSMKGHILAQGEWMGKYGR